MATSSSAAAVAGGPPRDGGAGVAGSDLFSPPWGSVGRSLTLGLVSGFAKLVLKVLNETVVLNEEGLTAAVTARGEGQGLLTVCNHVRCGTAGAAKCRWDMGLERAGATSMPAA